MNATFVLMAGALTLYLAREIRKAAYVKAVKIRK